MAYAYYHTPMDRAKAEAKRKRRIEGELAKLREQREEIVESILEIKKDKQKQMEAEIMADLVAGRTTIAELLGAEAMEMIQHYRDTNSLVSTLRKYCGEAAALNISRGLQSEDTQERYAHTKLVSDMLSKDEQEQKKQKIVDVTGVIDLSPVDEEILKDYMQERGV